MAAAGAALLLAGCAPTPPNGTSGDKLRVVATTTQLGDFTEQIGGGDIELVTLLAPGASAHHFDPSPKQLLDLGTADALVENGAELEGFLESATEASGFDGVRIVAADGVDLVEAEATTHEVEHGTEEAGHDHDSHHDHDHGPVNPHLWTSPTYAQGMVTEIADGLAKADPEHAEGYQSRAEAYVVKLQLLDEWIAAQVEQVPVSERLFVSGHNAMSYYLHDYDITYVGSLLPGFEDNAEPSAAEIDALIEEIEDRGVTAIFTESSISPKLAETVAKHTGAVWVSGEDALYVDTLGTPGSGAADYIGATVHNTTTILEAWGFEVQAPPAELAE